MSTIDLLRTGQLAGTQKLELAAELTEFPMEILDLADSLEILDLSNNHLKQLPDEFGRLKKLRIVFFNNNCFEEVPEVLSQCPQLSMVGFKSNQVRTLSETALPPLVRWLILTNNRLQELPNSIGQLTRLQKLMLAGNQLRSLPDTLANCQNLELIRLAANRLTVLPDWLWTLPRLSWLAYSGNPFCEAAAQEAQVLSHEALSQIEWADLTIGAVLGQGASGVIYKGLWQVEGKSVEVAVKLFKGDITSDGFPLDEMRACIAAGTHPNLVRVLGKVINHPGHSEGLVFSFIPSRYKNLGGPPSLESCTRDTYSPNATFTLPVILRIAQGIAAVTAHLHTRGIMHGDLYPHNILVDETGESLMGDFGAACFFDRNDRLLSRSLQSLEVRAFGCMLEDLLDRCPAISPQTEAVQAEAIQIKAIQIKAIDRLRRLQQDCMNPIPVLRPLFHQICEILADIGEGV